jgi:hypothetical protein
LQAKGLRHSTNDMSGIEPVRPSQARAMNRAFSAGCCFGHQPRALPWADMKDAFGVAKQQIYQESQ